MLSYSYTTEGSDDNVAVHLYERRADVHVVIYIREIILRLTCFHTHKHTHIYARAKEVSDWLVVHIHQRRGSYTRCRSHTHTNI